MEDLHEISGYTLLIYEPGFLVGVTFAVIVAATFMRALRVRLRLSVYRAWTACR